jgi:hypothetical protein
MIVAYSQVYLNESICHHYKGQKIWFNKDSSVNFKLLI